MEANEIFSKLRELGHVNSRRDELIEFCKEISDQITKLLPQYILTSVGADVLDCLFNGLPEHSTSSVKLKVKVVDIVLKGFREESTSLTHCGDVISRVRLELPHCPLEDLVRWSNDSVQSIMEDKDVNMIWRDILPETLSAIMSHEQVKHCGTEMSSAEFREQCVRTLCQCQWKNKQLVQLTAMFKDMKLSRDDHQRVVNKICSCMTNITPDSLPPLVHQLLKLYSKLEPPQRDSESTTMDIDDFEEHSPEELSRCLSTCIYHITQGAADPELIKKHLKQWPRSQLLKSPLILDVALALSDKGTDFRSVCVDVIKSAIEQRMADEQRIKESAWVRDLLPPDVDVTSVLKVLTTEFTGHRQLTALGLVRLGLALLASGRARSAGLLLVRVCKRTPEAAPAALALLADRLAAAVAQRQYAECLFTLCKLTPLSVERCSQLTTILESCQTSSTDFRAAGAVYDAVHPLINFSTRVRDTLVMVCRKGLYSRESQHRCLALWGFLSLLRYTRLSAGAGAGAGAGGSQSEYSAHSYLTQLSLDLHATNAGATVTSRIRNEAICMEVVSILRRCLLQDAVVKQLLYTHIYDCVKQKESLHELLLEMLYEHLSKYVTEEDEVNVVWDKCVQSTAITATLLEPIGYLIYAIAQFLQPVEEDLEDILASQAIEAGSAYLNSKLTNLLDKMSRTELCDLTLEKDIGLSDLTPESRAKSLKLQQLLQCYEALLGHQIMLCTLSSRNMNIVVKLYKSYKQVLEYVKSPAKAGKKGAKSSQNDTVKSQKSQKSQKEKGKAPVKLSNLVKDKAGPFKPLPCLWNLHTCCRIIELLYSEDVSWCNTDQRNLIRIIREFHHLCLKNIQSVVTSDCLEKRDIIVYIVKIANILYKRCLLRFQDLCDFDEDTAQMCIELFRDCFNLLISPNHNFKIEKFLPKICDSEAADVASLLECSLAALRCDEAAACRGALSRLAASLLLLPLGHFGEAYATVINELEEYVRTHEAPVLVVALLNAGVRHHRQLSLLDDLLQRVEVALGRIDEEESTAAGESETFSWIEEGSPLAHTMLAHISDVLATLAQHAADLVARVKEYITTKHLAIFTHKNIDRDIERMLKGVVVQLCQATTGVSRAVALRVAAAPSARVLRALLRLYAVLASLAQLLSSSFSFSEPESQALLQAIRMERLVRLSGRRLSHGADALVAFLEPTATARGRHSRLSRLFPALVRAAALFQRHLLSLARRSGINYQQYLSLGTARDFKIKKPILEERLQAMEHMQQDIEIEEDVHEMESTLDEEDEVDGNSPAKRKRLS